MLVEDENNTINNTSTNVLSGRKYYNDSNNEILYNVIFSNATSIQNVALQSNKNIVEISMPNVKYIGIYAFNNCTALTKITIPSSVTSIMPGDSANGGPFSSCTSLTDIIIQNNMIIDYQFMNCTALTKITIPDTVTSIGVLAFNKCSKLTNITFNGKLPSISILNSNKINLNILTEENIKNKITINYYSAYNTQFTEYFKNLDKFTLNVIKPYIAPASISSLLIIIIITIIIIGISFLLYKFIKKN